MDPKIWIISGTLLAGLGVAAGAFGAHGLEASLRLPESADQSQRELTAKKLHNFEVAVRYQMYHAMGLVLIGLLGLHLRSGLLTWAGISFIVGIVIFSGMLYGWVLTGSKPMVMMVPIGGLAFIVGWLALAAAGATAARQDSPASPTARIASEFQSAADPALP